VTGLTATVVGGALFGLGYAVLQAEVRVPDWLPYVNAGVLAALALAAGRLLQRIGHLEKHVADIQQDINDGLDDLSKSAAGRAVLERLSVVDKEIAMFRQFRHEANNRLQELRARLEELDRRKIR
jgi:hypothetical protein